MDLNSKKSYWDLKPIWCQPWSIITTGILLLLLSLITFNNLIIFSICAFFIVTWWVLFLIIAPNSYQGISDEKN